MPEFLRELGTLPCVLGLNFSQALHQAGKSLPPQNVDAWPLVSAAQIVDPRTCLSASQAAQRTEIRAVNDKLNAAAPFWDDELGQITCLAVLRTQNSTEDAAHATRGLVADRLLAWSGDRDARNHAAWQTMWNGTDAADAFETAITKVIAEQYGVVTRDGEGFAFSAKGRYVSLLRNRNSLGVLFLNTADAQSLADLSKLLND